MTTGNTTISQTEMSSHIAHGTAAALLPTGVPGPVHHALQWWAIRENDQDYQPVDDAAASRNYDDLARRYAAGVAAVSAEQDARAAQIPHPENPNDGGRS
jgi:hypothetical protein